MERGVSKKHFWGRDLTRDELRDPRAIDRLYRQALAGGLVTDSENHRLAFFRWARYCDQTGDNPPALFNYGLRGPDEVGQHWHERGSAEDEDWARDAIAGLRHAVNGRADDVMVKLSSKLGGDA